MLAKTSYFFLTIFFPFSYFFPVIGYKTIKIVLFFPNFASPHAVGQNVNCWQKKKSEISKIA